MKAKELFHPSTCIIVLIALFIFSAWGVSVGADSYEEAMKSWPAIEEAAKKEGKLVIYGFAQPDWDKRRVKLFKEMYPEIEVQKVPIRGNEPRNRIEAEIATNKGMGDVAYVGVDTALNMSAQDMLLPFSPPNALDPNVPWTTHPMAYAKNAFVFYGTYYGIGINKNLVKKSDYPESYKDLINTRWKDKMSLKEPRIPGSGNYFWYILEKLYGKDFLRKLMENKPNVNRSYWDQISKLTAGQNEMLLIMSKSESMKQAGKGAPIDWIAPKEGPIPIVIMAVASKAAPHPNAAKVWINFLLSKAMHKMRADNKGAPWRADVAEGSAFEDVAKMKAIPPFKEHEWKVVLPEKRKEAEALLKEYGL